MQDRYFNINLSFFSYYRSILELTFFFFTIYGKIHSYIGRGRQWTIDQMIEHFKCPCVIKEPKVIEKKYTQILKKYLRKSHWQRNWKMVFFVTFFLNSEQFQFNCLQLISSIE